ncbi:MAG: hypothetical protein RSA70_01700 [Clostridia bacterium]
MTIFNLGAVSKKIDVKKINVFGDKYTISKNLFGDIYASDEEKRAKINALYDMADILNRAEFIGKRPEPSYASDVPPKNAAHEGVKYWHKFKTDIILDGAPYTVIFNICDKGKEQFAYLIEFKEKERPTCHTVNKDFGLKMSSALSNTKIPQAESGVNPIIRKSLKNDTQSSLEGDPFDKFFGDVLKSGGGAGTDGAETGDGGGRTRRFAPAEKVVPLPIAGTGDDGGRTHTPLYPRCKSFEQRENNRK